MKFLDFFCEFGLLFRDFFLFDSQRLYFHLLHEISCPSDYVRQKFVFRQGMVRQHLPVLGATSFFVVHGQDRLYESAISITRNRISVLIIKFPFLQFLNVLSVLVQDIFSAFLLLGHSLHPIQYLISIHEIIRIFVGGSTDHYPKLKFNLPLQAFVFYERLGCLQSLNTSVYCEFQVRKIFLQLNDFLILQGRNLSVLCRIQPFQ